MSISTLALILGFVTLMLYYTMFYVPAKFERTITRKIDNIINLQIKMDEFKDDTAIEMCMLLTCHDGDGMPRLNTPIKATGIAISYDHPFKNVLGRYDNLKLTPDYLMMLEQVKITGSKQFLTHELEEGFFRDLCEKDGIFWGEVLFIGWDHKDWYYCIVATSSPTNPHNVINQAADIELFQQYLQGRFEKMNKRGIRGLREKLFV